MIEATSLHTAWTEPRFEHKSDQLKETFPLRFPNPKMKEVWICGFTASMCTWLSSPYTNIPFLSLSKCEGTLDVCAFLQEMPSTVPGRRRDHSYKWSMVIHLNFKSANKLRWTWLKLQKLCPRHLPSNRKKQTANEEDGDVSLVFCDAFVLHKLDLQFWVQSAIVDSQELCMMIYTWYNHFLLWRRLNEASRHQFLLFWRWPLPEPIFAQEEDEAEVHYKCGRNATILLEHDENIWKSYDSGKAPYAPVSNNKLVPKNSTTFRSHIGIHHMHLCECDSDRMAGL